MCASLNRFLRSGPPPPKVALLPDAHFFVRAVPVDPAATPAEAGAEIELALETLSPFPLSHVYYGYFWAPGSSRALVYAAYRKRFTAEEVATWAGFEMVMPAFAAFLGAAVAPATTFILASAEGVTALHWDKDGSVPSQVLHRPIPSDASSGSADGGEAAIAQARAQVRDELLAQLGGSKQVVDLTSPPEVLVSRNDREFTFRSGSVTSVLKGGLGSTLDVRDRGDLASLRRSRGRDVALWRVAVGSVAACLLMGLGELALVGGHLWQSTRTHTVAVQTPVVARIMADQELANRISDLSTKRLLPMEMISLVAAKKPAEVVFLQARSVGITALQVDAQTNNAGVIPSFRSALESLPECASVEAKVAGARDSLTPFTLIVTFKPSALRPMTAPAPAS